ncbi:reverse transcriptase domain-containing protein [Tanacetum coccineum]
MEFVFHISNCTIECQVKYATCTLLGGALTWWNSYVRSVGHDAAYRMPWKILIKMITEAYCPRSELKKLETKLWNLTVKGTDVESYTQCFQELVLLCSRMIPNEADKVEMYVRGLPDNIQGMNARDRRTKIVGIKPEMEKLVEGCMLWEEEKSTRTLTTLQMMLKLKERFSLSYLVKPKLELS